MFKAPQVSTATFEYEYIDSIITFNKRISVNKNHILRNTKHVYEISQPCEEQTNYFLYELSQLEHVNECTYNYWKLNAF